MRDRRNIASDIAWPIVAEREGLPEPGKVDPMHVEGKVDPDIRPECWWMLGGLLLASATVMVLAAIKFGPAISAAVRGWL